MKKIILITLLISALSLPSMAIAGSIGNIADTQGEGGRFSIGVEYDSVLNRDLKFKSGTGSVTMGGITTTEPLVGPGLSIKDMKMQSNRIFLKGTIGVHPNIDLFAKLGMADARFEYKYIATGFPDIMFEFDGDHSFAYGIGGKVKIFETPGGLRLLGNAQYLRYEVEGKVKAGGVDLAIISAGAGILGAGGLGAPGAMPAIATASYTSKTKIEEWQLALYVNKDFGQFSPYVGTKYSDLRLKNETNISGRLGDGTPYSARVDLKGDARRNFGIFAGADIKIIPNKLSVNIEGRFIDETAATIGMKYRF